MIDGYFHRFQIFLYLVRLEKFIGVRMSFFHLGCGKFLGFMAQYLEEFIQFLDFLKVNGAKLRIFLIFLNFSDSFLLSSLVLRVQNPKI